MLHNKLKKILQSRNKNFESHVKTSAHHPSIKISETSVEMQITYEAQKSATYLPIILNPLLRGNNYVQLCIAFGVQKSESTREGGRVSNFTNGLLLFFMCACKCIHSTS